MKKIYLTLAALALGAVATLSVNAATVGPLTCFDGITDTPPAGGHCTIVGSTATLDNTVTNVNGTYSGVYYPNDTLKGMLLSNITKLSFSYTGTPTAGSPRISLPIATSTNGITDFYAFIGANTCNDGLGNVNPLTDLSCTIYAGSETFVNWAAFVAAHPTWTVGNNATFVIADDPGIWTVSNVMIGDAPIVSTVPTSKDQCKNGGWMTFTNPSYKNQGQCVSSVSKNK